MKMIYLLTVVSFLVCGQGVSVEASQDYQTTMLLPINWTTPAKYNLAVKIPEGFRSLQPINQFSDASATTIEFVPKNETDDGWTRIITVMKLIGKQIQAGKFTDDLKNMMSKQARNVKVLESNVTKGNFFEKASFALSYDYHAKHEVIGVLYYSGPSDMTGVQYTIRTERGQSDADALGQIHKFFNTQVQVIN